MTNSTDISTFAEVIDLWPSAEAMADDIGVQPGLPPVWKHRRAIPSKHWMAIAEAAKAREIHDVTVETLAALAAKSSSSPKLAAPKPATPANQTNEVEMPMQSSPPFKKILIANRGEIACRIIRTAKRLGIKTVAVFSDADVQARHVDMADEAINIGPAAAAESYLVIDKIISAVGESGAEAVHPGYGFLSENAGFVAAVEKAGITFIGPDTNAIGAMGDKIESKRLAAKAGVNTIPGSDDAIADVEAAVTFAREIGYPVMIKASAGGGGKGLRAAGSDDEVREGFERAVSEARSSFGDDRVFVEKFVEKSRHIEIQVIADSFGNTIHLGERECSVQRRHQKVVEEAPSPFLDAALRAEMGAQAVALAKAVGYRSAGTVEFIVAADRSFYFLEMNTRLQVEHPVTEYVTGLDLVELMIRIAAGGKLPITQDQVKMEGWAVETRVYAEDPVRGFLPSTGRLVRYRPPEASETIRIDTGIGEGDEVSLFYDPMIAKLISFGATRDEAIDRQADALDRFHIRGPAHNIGFLGAIMANAKFRSGDISTDFIAEEWPDGFTGTDAGPITQARFSAVAALVHLQLKTREMALGQTSGAAPANPIGPGSSFWVAQIGQEKIDLEISRVEGGIDVVANDQTFAVRGDWTPVHHLFDGSINGHGAALQVDRVNGAYEISAGGISLKISIREPHVADFARHMPGKLPPDTSKLLMSPMPGMIVAIKVTEGEEVEAGQPLVIVDAMKMENVLNAERSGKIAKVMVAAGDSVAVDQILIEFE